MGIYRPDDLVTPGATQSLRLLGRKASDSGPLGTATYGAGTYGG